MGKSKASIRKSIESYRKLIEAHHDKIDQAIETGINTETIPHWEQEIRTFTLLLEKELRKLTK